MMPWVWETNRGIDVANDDFRRGTINISSGGAATLDASSGTSVVSWYWDSSTGTFRFEFSTIYPDTFRGLLSITVEVIDGNGNTTEVKLSLPENPGPYIDLWEPGNSIVNFREGITTLEIYGTVTDSSTTTSASEVIRLSWGAVGQVWSGVLDDFSATPPLFDGTVFRANNQGLYISDDFHP